MIMNKEKAIKFAFTMAETLITMTIIGVLMALMLRAINRVNPDKDKILFLKSYHAVETVVGNVINDATKYDQNTDSNSDFSSLPLPTAKATINGATYCTNQFQETTEDTCSNKIITASNALCYFLADQINFVGGLNCRNNTGVNFKSTSGVCFYDWVGSGTRTGRVDPNCEKKGYAITVYNDGRVTIPSSASGTTDQAAAYRWINDQTQIKN